MIRLFGVLTGAALAIGLLLLVLGVPELAGPPVTDSEHAPDVAAIIPTPQAPPEVPQEPEPETPTTEEPEPSVGAETMAAPAAQPAPEPEMTAPVDPGPEPGIVTADTLTIDDAPTENWYAFWSPFRSRIAADGFVSELSRTTGLDYRVVKLKPGVYEVAVAYTDDADIEDKLTRISAATGLDMSGG